MCCALFIAGTTALQSSPSLLHTTLLPTATAAVQRLFMSRSVHGLARACTKPIAAPVRTPSFVPTSAPRASILPCNAAARTPASTYKTFNTSFTSAYGPRFPSIATGPCSQPLLRTAYPSYTAVSARSNTSEDISEQDTYDQNLKDFDNMTRIDNNTFSGASVSNSGTMEVKNSAGGHRRTQTLLLTLIYHTNTHAAALLLLIT
jgi:hypothetical protein